MASKTSTSTQFVAECGDCAFRATGAEAYCRRKGSFHAKSKGHEMTVGQGPIDG
jgi:Zn-dependent alcohol dehydrogenase